MKNRWLLLSFLIFYGILFYLFYLKYVPLVQSFQLVLGPLLVVLAIITSIDKEKGIYLFIFLFPLINNLPYFFGIEASVPHAPPALVLFLAFLFGWIINQIAGRDALDFRKKITQPMVLFILLVVISAVITSLRFLDFFPFLRQNSFDFIVNVNGVRAGGAVMSVIFSALNYLTGLLLFFIVAQQGRERKFIKRASTILLLSTSIAVIFSYCQLFFTPELGNTSLWISLDRSNGTFKDPNAFGLFLSVCFPLVLGMFFQTSVFKKIWLLLLGISIIAILPFTGSRSGFLAIIMSMITFFLLINWKNKEKLAKRRYFLVIAVLVVVIFVFLFKSSSLFNRFEKNINVLSTGKLERESLNSIFTGKIQLWIESLRMLKDYPLTGVGVGSFIIELPNYALRHGQAIKFTDSAENYFLQIGSELGLPGLILIFWIFIEVFKKIIALLKEKKSLEEGENFGSREMFFLVGIVSGLVAVLINFLFHSYIGSFESIYLFWLLIAFLDIHQSPENSPEVQKRGRMKIIWGLILGGLAVVFLWNATHRLSLESFTKRFNINQNFGLYRTEKDNRGFTFNWMKKRAGITVENLGKTLIIPLKVSHPDVREKPVYVSLFKSDEFFHNPRLIEKIRFNDSQWRFITIEMDEGGRSTHALIFETSRTWQPLKSLGHPDPRRLGAAMGMPYFLYTPKTGDITGKAIKILGEENWRGPQENHLFSNGEAQMSFSIEDEKGDVLLIQLKGQKAYGIGPYVVVSLNGSIIGKTMVNQDDWVELAFPIELKKDQYTLEVEFVNDFNDREKKQDRNLFLGKVIIIKKFS